MLKYEAKRRHTRLSDRPRPETRPQGRLDAPSFKQRQRVKLRVTTVATQPAGDPPQRQLPTQPEHEEEAFDKGTALKSFLHRHPLASVLAVVLLAVALSSGYVYWDFTGHFQSTDDAFITSRQIAIAPKVSGYVTQVPVTDNQHVPADGVIVRIDDREYAIALEQAKDQIAAAQAAIQNIDAQSNTQRAQIDASQAQVDQAQASLVFAKQQAERYGKLGQTGYGTVQNAQQYSSQLSQQEAAVKNAKGAFSVAQLQIESLKAQRKSAEANLEQAGAQRDQAALNLSYTTVTAAEPGRVVNLTAEPGEFAQMGTNLTMFVPDDIWVTANFKETQLNQMRPGQPVTLSIDAYPGRQIHGHVASVQPGSGTAFSLLPAQNATGNYVKIVQRVPVKVVIDNPPTDVALGPGMSVAPSVRTNPKPALYERIASPFHRGSRS
jgi:membrane fusion protein, multidrug efflux system